MSESLQENDDEGHQRFNQTELQCGLFAEAQKTDCVGFASQAAGAVETGRFDGLATDFGHDVALATEVFVAEGQEVVYYKCCKAGKRKKISLLIRFTEG
jgi:hypothetical protein